MLCCSHFDPQAVGHKMEKWFEPAFFAAEESFMEKAIEMIYAKPFMPDRKIELIKLCCFARRQQRCFGTRHSILHQLL